MKYLDLSLPTPEANLACDEALLEVCDEASDGAVLRVWESPSIFVVVGYSNQVSREVRVDLCRSHNIPILRRCTGGGTVVQGPGCLNYSLCLRMEEGGPLATITQTNCFIMSKLRQVFQDLLQTPVDIRGHTDLAIADRKFSGNAQRRKQRSVLFHGSILLHFDLALIEALLPAPSQQPAYRASRPHLDFVRNLPLAASDLKSAFCTAWQAHEALNTIPNSRISQLIEEKYGRADWNHRF